MQKLVFFVAVKLMNKLFLNKSTCILILNYTQKLDIPGQRFLIKL